MARLRTFIAIELSKQIRDQLTTLQESLARAGTEVKWVETANMHVTLLFLGEVDDRDVIAVCRAVQEACAKLPPFRISVETVGCFPNLRRPRVVWVGVKEGAEQVVALHGALEAPLLELGCYRREDRQYTPHITLGRIKKEGTTDPLAALLAKKATWHGGEIHVKEVLVLSSELTSQGPVYSVLARGKLGGEVT